MTEEEKINEALDTWAYRKGKGSFMMPCPLDAIKPIYLAIPRLLNKSPTSNVVIVINDFKDKDTIKDYLTKQGNIYDGIYLRFINNGQIKVLSIDWIIDNINQYSPSLTIIYSPNSFTFAHLGLLDKSTFKLVILTKVITDIDNYYSVCPLIKEFKQNEVDNIRTNPPVEETRIPISIKDDTKEAKLLDYYNNNIRTALNIFGGLENLKKAMTGTTNNTSAIAYCDYLARLNGWNEHLDMTTEYNQQIDKLYNPIAIQESANTCYDMIRKRSKLIANYSYKVNAILDIIDSNKDKKILIINKYADFANEIRDNINEVYQKTICMSYHDKLESIPAVDKDGNPVYYKSGSKKGKQKTMGITTQKKLAQQLFNMNRINVLSVSNAPDKTLSVDIDIVIITSSLCDDIKSYLYRLDKVNFTTPIILYSLYCENTMEEKAINDKVLSDNHVIVNKTTKSVKDDNNFDYTIVD